MSYSFCNMLSPSVVKSRVPRIFTNNFHNATYTSTKIPPIYYSSKSHLKPKSLKAATYQTNYYRTFVTVSMPEPKTGTLTATEKYNLIAHIAITVIIVYLWCEYRRWQNARRVDFERHEEERLSRAREEYNETHRKARECACKATGKSTRR